MEDLASYEDAILWDVIDEHFDEAEFGLEQLERAFESPTRNLRDIARYPEERLLAHIDGLVVGGRPVMEQRLTPTLEAADAGAPMRITAAALALIHAGEHDRLRPALASGSPVVARAATRACELASHPKLEAWAHDRLNEDQSPEALAALLEYVAASNLPTPPHLLQWLQTENTVLARAAARAAIGGESSRYLPVIEHLLDHADEQVRDAALTAALAWGSQR